jgi:hypothetical protein
VGTFALQSQFIETITPTPTVTPTEEDDDDFEVWEEFNATYFAIVFFGAFLFDLGLGFWLDRIKYRMTGKGAPQITDE